jgi:hypothetical protein
MDPNKTNNTVCKAHSGLIARIESCEENVKALRKKWDNNQKLMLVILGGIIANLVILLIKWRIGNF